MSLILLFSFISGRRKGGLDMNRLYKIAMVILENEEPITTNHIAMQLGVSVKTIRNDMKKLDDILGKEGLCLVKKTGIGNYIDGPESNKRLFLHGLKKDLDYVEPFSVEGRQNHILKRLLLDGDQVTAGKLADEMFVSTSTVYKDLKQLEQVLTPYKLRVIKDDQHVLSLRGDEKQYRRAVCNLIFQTEEKMTDTGDELSMISRLDYSTRKQLEALMKIDYLILEKHITELENQLAFQFTQEAFIMLVIHIAIAIRRIKDGKDVLLTDETLDSLKVSNEFKVAKEMSECIGKSFGIAIPEQEVGYITLHVLGSKVGRENLESINFGIETIEEMELAAEIAHKMVNIASDALHMNFGEDEIFIKGLVLHLRPTINRLKYGLPLRNPIIEEIKTNYPDIFGVAWMCGKVLRKYFDVSVPESEIGYIALHIGASIERNRKMIKALVVCTSGIGTSQLLSARLKRCFKELDIIGIRSTVSLSDSIIEEADIIISTVPLHMKVNKPVYMISPLFTSDDVKKVEWMVENYQKKAPIDGTDNIGKEVFIRNKSFKDKDEVITEICKSLVKRNYICKSYEKTVKEREKIYSTEVGRGIAIPHGSFSEVKKSCISVTVLKHPVRWAHELVEFVFLVSLKEDDLKYAKIIFVNLSDAMDTDAFRERLRSGQSGAMQVIESMLLQ